MLSVNLHISKNTLTIRLNGEMDQNTTDELRLKLNEFIIKYDIHNLIFNMRNLEFMDSSGIGIIIGRYNQIKDKGKIIICEMNNQVKKIVNLSGLLRICNIYESEEMSKISLGVKC